VRVHQTLRNFELFAEFSDTALNCIADVIVPRTYTPDALIVVEGDPCDAAYFVVSGEVQVYRMSPQGRQQVLVRLGPGQAFNTVPIFESNGENRASAVALTDVTLFAVLKDDFRRVIHTCPDLAMVILRDFADRLTHLTDLVEDLALRSVRGRLARFLLQQADGKQLTQRWTQDEIAAHLGTVRDMVGRSLRSLTDANLIRIDRGRIVLLDRDALEVEAET
jgi:CRP/FNR family cyclic AMP-dependent transcriptional regulator